MNNKKLSLYYDLENERLILDKILSKKSSKLKKQTYNKIQLFNISKFIKLEEIYISCYHMYNTLKILKEDELNGGCIIMKDQTDYRYCDNHFCLDFDVVNFKLRYYFDIFFEYNGIISFSGTDINNLIKNIKLLIKQTIIHLI
jgi:hypothetical protein